MIKQNERSPAFEKGKRTIEEKKKEQEERRDNDGGYRQALWY